MMIGAVTHQKIAGEIQRLIHQEQYTAAQELLPSFAQAVIEACNQVEQEQEFKQAKQFLQSAVTAVKARRAHYLMQADELNRHRALLGTPNEKADLDCTG